MNFDEYLMMFIIITVTIFMSMYVYTNAYNSKYVITEHNDYELKYNESISKIDKLESKLDNTEKELKYCEDYKNIRFDWSFIFYLTLISFLVFGFIYINKNDDKNTKKVNK